MIINNQIPEAQVSQNVIQNKIGVDRNNIDFITTLLTSNLYSKPLESFIRETIANGLDAQIEAGNTNKPLLLLLEMNTYSSYISSNSKARCTITVRDYGTGISPERFESIYKNIGSSTKRDSNDYIGAFGIGRFSCLSVSDSAEIISYYNGKKYFYLMYKDGQSINIDLANVSDTTEPNGLSVSVKTEATIDEIRISLYKIQFFKNVHVTAITNNADIEYIVADFNNRKVYEYNNFVVGKEEFMKKLGPQIKMGAVLYDVPDNSVLNKLNTKSLILNLPMGSIDITPSRESIQISKRTSSVVTDTYINAVKELSALVEQSLLLETDSLMDYCYKYGIGHDAILVNKLFYVDTSDVKNIDYDRGTIKGNKIPKGFHKYMESLWNRGTDESAIYKAVNSSIKTVRYFYRHLIKSSGIITIKEDRLKKITLDYYINRVAVNRSIPHYLISSQNWESMKMDYKYGFADESSWFGVDPCAELFVKCLDIRQLKNSDVPKDFKPNQKQCVASDTIKMRVYNGYGFEICTYSKEKLAKLLDNKRGRGIIVYGKHERDDSIYKSVARTFQTGYYVHDLIVVTFTESDLKKYPIVTQQFINVTDFIYKKHKYVNKCIEKYLITKNFVVKDIPLYDEFTKEYKKCYYEETEFFLHLIDIYKANNWINQEVIDRYKLTEEELEIVAYKRKITNNPEKYSNFAAIRKFGIKQTTRIIQQNGKHYYKW